MLSRENFKSDEDFISALRDWFAGQAMSRDLTEGIYVDGEGMKSVAKAAYEMADAMLAARSLSA